MAKTSLEIKVNWRCFQVHVVQFVKCRWSFLELNSKGLFQCYEKQTTSSSCVHALNKRWNKAVTARRSGAACDSIKMYKKAWFACIVVVLLTAYCFFDVRVAVPYLSPVDTNTSIDSRAHCYQHFDAFPTIHTKTFEKCRNAREVSWSWTLV